MSRQSSSAVTKGKAAVRDRGSAGAGARAGSPRTVDAGRQSEHPEPPEPPDAPEQARPEPEPKLFGISQAAAACGVSERALRYYQELGLLQPTGRTPGGMRRYSATDFERVRRIRELQSLLGFDLDQIRAILESDDRLAAIKQEYRLAPADSERRRELLRQSLSVREHLREQIDAKVSALQAIRAELKASITRIEEMIAADE